MSKRFVPLAALAVAFSPIAIAESQAFSVDLSYDGGLLSEEAGAISVMKSLKSQARDACVYNSALTHIETVDRACVNDIITKAVNKIVLEREAAGLETADVFMSRSTIQLAALDQG